MQEDNIANKILKELSTGDIENSLDLAAKLKVSHNDLVGELNSLNLLEFVVLVNKEK